MDGSNGLFVAKRFTLAIVLMLAVAGLSRSQSPQKDAVSLVRQLIERVNAKQKDDLHKFLTDNLVAGAEGADRMTPRLIGFGDQGAPFKFAKEPALDGDSVKAILEDKNGEKLSLVVAIQTSPVLKIASLRVLPLDVAEGPNPALAEWTDLNNLAEKIAKNREAPALAVATIRAGDLRVGAWGIREIRKPASVGVDDVWSIGSIGKPICSTVIGRLIEMGKLRWDETLKEALPDIPMRKEYEVVTLEQLMMHRSGVPQDLGFTKKRLDEIIGSESDPVKIRNLYAKDILNREPIGKPGEKFAYSNAGYSLLGHIAEVTMDKPYEHLVRSLVFEPLGLKHSYTASDPLPAGRPSGHVAGPNGLTPSNFSGPLEFLVAPAGGGMFMSVGDLAKFGEAHLQGLLGKDGLLKSATVMRLHTGLKEQPDADRKYACGWSLTSIPNIQPWHGHNGSNGTMRSELAIFPDANLVVVAITNMGGEAEPSPALQAVFGVALKYAQARK